jgi:hypothetical protein
MIARGFKSVLWVGAVGSAALGCYMVSLRVATERADLARVELRIVEAKRDIRSLQTELGTRGRLAQLEDWNSNVLALSAPGSSQFVKDGYALARLQTRQATVEDRTGDVRMAALDTGPAVPEAKAQPSVPAAAPGKPVKPAPAPAAPQASSLPRVVQAVAAPAATHVPPLVHRASFATGAPAEAAAAPAHAAARPSRPKPDTAATPLQDVIARLDSDRPAPTKKAKTAARAAEAAAPARHDPRPALRIAARADKPEPARPAKPAKAARAAPKLAAADGAVHPASSGHRGGAQ